MIAYNDCSRLTPIKGVNGADIADCADRSDYIIEARCSARS
jgi:hypothetical protein